MKPVRICFISLFVYPLFNPEIRSEFGGAELQLYYLATELSADPQFKISFITGDYGQPNVEIRNGIEIYKFVEVKRKIKYISSVWWIIKYWLLLRKAKSDIYIQRAAGMITGLTAFFCKTNDKKFIYMAAHDADVMDKKPGWLLGGTIGNMMWKMFKTGLKISDLVIVQHNAQLENLKKFYRKEGYIRPSAHKMFNKPDSSGESILWVARCEDWKQPELFLELSESFPEEKFVMVCPVSKDTEYFNRIKDRALSLPNLQFVDYVPFNEIQSYFSNSKIFINTSKHEGFPNTYIQAFVGRTAVLSMNVNPDGMFERFDIGRCANGSFEQLKRGLADLLSDAQLGKKLSDNAYKYVESRHDIKKIINDDKKNILKVLNPNRKALDADVF